MRRIAVLGGLVAALIVPAGAMAWSAQPVILSCGEAHFNVSIEKTPWTYVVTQDGVQTATGSVVSTTTQLSIGVRSTDNLGHVMKVTISNGEARASQSATWALCGPPPAGPAGPKGDKGDTGATGATGANGKDGATGQTGKDGSSSTVIDRVGKLPTCTSHRVYKFVVRKRYHGRVITGPVKASDRGAKISIKRNAKGRYVVSADYSGLKVGAFTYQRHIFVSAVVAGRGRLAFNENVDLCRPANGAQNAPSASGDAKG